MWITATRKENKYENLPIERERGREGEVEEGGVPGEVEAARASEAAGDRQNKQNETRDGRLAQLCMILRQKNMN